MVPLPSARATLLDPPPAPHPHTLLHTRRVHSPGFPLQVSQESMGTTTTIDLVPEGVARPVTNDNRQEYVDLYSKW